jgi:hypothetical protein
LLPFAVLQRSHTAQADQHRYQERLMSPRQLNFLESQVVFHCHQSTFREDVILESPTISMCLDHTGHRFFYGFDDVDPLELYSGCLWEYSTRNVSFEQDRVAAFFAVLEIVQNKMTAMHNIRPLNTLRSHAGLPALLFDWALLWEPSKPLIRSESTMWPSWSWSGWHGQVASFETATTSVDCLDWSKRSWIAWYYCLPRRHPQHLHVESAVLRRHRSPRDLLKPQPSSGNTLLVGQHLPRPQLSTQEGLTSNPDLLAALNYSEHLLVFVTLSLNASVKPIPIEATNVTHSSPWRAYYVFQHGADEPLGRVLLDKNWTPAFSTYEFIALSTAHPRKESELALLGRGESLSGDSGWRAFNVLMLHYPRDPRVAERLALGLALQWEFEEGAKWKEIWLG